MANPKVKIKGYLDKKRLSELPYYLSMCEYKIYKLIASGASLKERRLENLKYKRAKIRRILFERLNNWIKNPYSEKDYTFSEIEELEKLKKIKEQLGDKDDELLAEIKKDGELNEDS